MNHLRRTIVLLAALLAASVPSFADDKQQEGEALLARSRQLLEFRAPGNPAFRLTAQFRLADPSLGFVQGTYQEVWVSPQQWRRETNAGNYHQIEISRDKKRWALHTMNFDSYRFDQVRPSLSLSAVDLKQLKVQKIYDKKIGGIPVRCVDINAGEQSGVLFCLDAASGLPVFHEVRMLGRVSSAAYTNYASLGSHSYAREIHEFLDGKLSREMTITNLTLEPAPDESLFAPSEDLQQVPYCSDKEPPQALPVTTYSPELLAERHSTTPAEVLVSIGIDGKIHDAKVVQSSGNRERDDAILTTVRLWRFKPATCDGQPVPAVISVSVGPGVF